MIRRLRRLLARLGLRLLLFNVMLVFLPLGAMLVLDRTEQRLLESQERAMVQQGRLVAAALSEPRPAVRSAVDEGRRLLPREAAVGLLWRLRQQTTARIRIYDAAGELLADSSQLGPRRQEVEVAEPSSNYESEELRERVLYRLGAAPFRAWQSVRGWLQDPDSRRSVPSAEAVQSRVVEQALEGRYGAASLRLGEARSTTLYSAIPVRAAAPLALSVRSGTAAGSVALGALPVLAPSSGEILGVVLVSQSTAQILADLDAARIEVGRVVVLSLVVAVLLSLLLAGTIARPLRRLRRDAEGLLDAGGRLVGGIESPRRYDEIGDLRDALRGLASRLRKQQDAAESFAADTAHEIKNPLAAIRSASEVLATVDDPADRDRFVQLIQGNVARAEQLLSSLRELAAIDVGLEEDRQRLEVSGHRALPGCDLASLAREIAENRAAAEQLVLYDGPDGSVFVRGRAERLEQVVDNLVSNALSFSPSGEPVQVRVLVDRSAGDAVLRVSDRGPGVPPADSEKIFRRFYSYRPQSSDTAVDSAHAGLGLAIVRSVVEAYGGSVVARNAAEGGAVFECRLPLMD